MREVQINRWCDACFADGERHVEGETYTAAVSTGESRPEPKVLDLCGEHAKALISPLADLLALTGQRPELAPNVAQRPLGRPRGVPNGQGAGERVECEICGTTLARGSMAMHVWNVHLDGKRPATGTRCPLCGESFASEQGLAMHRFRLHGRTALDDAYTAARSAGLLR